MAKRRMSTFERLEGGRLNRKQRRELGRQVAAADPGLTIVHANAGGIDVGNESHYVAVPPDRDPNPVREFGCWTAALHQMAEWLKPPVTTAILPARVLISLEIMTRFPASTF